MSQCIVSVLTAMLLCSKLGFFKISLAHLKNPHWKLFGLSGIRLQRGTTTQPQSGDRICPRCAHKSTGSLIHRLQCALMLLGRGYPDHFSDTGESALCTVGIFCYSQEVLPPLEKNEGTVSVHGGAQCQHGTSWIVVAGALWGRNSRSK